VLEANILLSMSQYCNSYKQSCWSYELENIKLSKFTVIDTWYYLLHFPQHTREISLKVTSFIIVDRYRFILVMKVVAVLEDTVMILLATLTKE
jgi:hypothetical protein